MDFFQINSFLMLTNLHELWYNGVMDEKEGTGPVFGETKPTVLCTWSECIRGHRWVPVMALVKCSGCEGPSLMVKMQNCPYCNEPVARMSLRSDHLPSGQGVAKRCKGEKPAGESITIEMKRELWKEVESGKKENG